MPKTSLEDPSRGVTIVAQLDNLVLPGEFESLDPNILPTFNTPWIFVACGWRPRSTFRML